MPALEFEALPKQVLQMRAMPKAAEAWTAWNQAHCDGTQEAHEHHPATPMGSLNAATSKSGKKTTP